MALELEVVNIAGEKIGAFRFGETSTLPELRAAIQAIAGIPAVSQRLLHGTRELVGAGCLGELLHGCSLEVPLTIVRVPRTLEQTEWLERLTDRRRHWVELRNAPAEVTGDHDCVLAALAQDVDAIEYASEELRTDRGFVLAALQQNGLALQHATAELWADRGLVLAAVQQRGEALEFVSAELRADRGVVLAALQQNGDSLRFASAWLQTSVLAQQAKQRVQSWLAGARAEAARLAAEPRWRCCCRRWRRGQEDGLLGSDAPAPHALP